MECNSAPLRIKFMSCKAKHNRKGVTVTELVVESAEDAVAANLWASENDYPVEARVASEEEVAEWRKWQEMY